MKPNSTEFKLDKEHKAIHIKRSFNADISEVWNAWTKNELLDQWWGPKPWSAVTKSHELSPKGGWFYSMNGPNGEEHWGKVEYQKIEEPNRLIWIDWFSDENGNRSTELTDSHWDIKFKKENDQTLMEITITHDKFEDIETIIEMGFKEGITQCFEQLDELLENNVL